MYERDLLDAPAGEHRAVLVVQDGRIIAERLKHAEMVINIDGGGFLAGGGNFSQLSKLGDGDWENIRNMIKSANDKDRTKRTV